MDFEIISLKAKLDELNGDKASLEKLREALLRFKCSKSFDEENFLHNKAIFYDEHNKARTYILLKDQSIAAYFTIAFKSIDLKEISNNEVKSMTGGESKVESYSAFLIGHIAKSDNTEESLGDFILDKAFDLIVQAQDIIGGRLVYIDCKDEKKLISFYQNNGFKFFQKSAKTGLLQFYKKI